MNVLKRRVLLLVLLVIALFGLTILGASAATDAPQGVLETAKDPSATYVASATVTVGTATESQVYYYTSLADAINEADDGTTVTVLANTTLDKSVTLNGKSVTIQGASKDIVLTQNPSMLITINGITSLKLKDITITSTAAAKTHIINVASATAAIEIDNITYNAANAVRLIQVTTNGNLATLNVSNSTFHGNLLYVADTTTAKVCSAATPAKISNVTFNESAGAFLYGYGGKNGGSSMYVDIFGGSFSGQFLYGGDGSTTTIQLRVNPTGDTTTTFANKATRTDAYSSWIHLNPSTKTDVAFVLRNMSFVENGNQVPVIAIKAATNVSFNVENSTFTANTLLSLAASCDTTFANDETAATLGYPVRLGNTEGGKVGTVYYNNVASAIAASKTGDTITVIGNTTVSSAFAITDKSITITTAEGVTLTVNATISIGNGATVTFSGATISGSGNNESSPFALTATTTKGTLKFVNSTVTVAKDLISVSGSNALLGDVIADKSTLNVTADTLFDYRNKNASTSVSFTAQNGCQLNVANLNYTTVDTLGALKVNVINSTVTSTAKTFLIDSTAAITLDLTIQDSTVSTTSVLVQTGSSTKVKLIAKFVGTKSGTTDANATFTNSVQSTSHIFDLYGKTADSVDISITGTKLTTNERVFNVQALAQPAAGKGFTDADGKGNFAMRVNVENVHATCRYFFITQTTNTVGNVLFVMNGTKTGAGASAVHSNVITLSTGAFIYLDDVVALSQFRISGVKASFTNAEGQNLVIMTGNGHTIDMEFEGITFASTLHSNGRVFSGNDGKSLNTLRLVIKDSNLTANDKSTYSNEISSKEIAFLLRSFRNLDISVAGTIFAGGTTFNVQTPVVSEENLSCSITLTDVSSTSGGALVSTKALTCDFFLTLTNVDMVASKLIDFATSYAKTATVTATNSKITKSSVAYDISGSYKLTKDSAVITHTGDHYSVLKNLITGVSGMVLYATTGTNEYTYFAALNQTVVDAATANATKQGVITIFANDTSASTGSVLDNKTVTIVGLNGAKLTSSAARLFTLTNGANLTIKDLKINTTTASTTVATAGTILAFDDATATAKCFATLTNVEVTAAGIPFYFGGVSTIDLTITGGAYNGVGMFAFGVAANNLDNTADVRFNGTANVTITGTASTPVTLKRASGSGDTRSIIFVNRTNAVSKDLVKFTINYATLESNGYDIYLRGSNALTLDVKNSTIKGSTTLISSQGGCAWFADFENTKFTSSKTGSEAIRPYGASGAGSYMNFKGCEFDIKATLAFSSAIAVTMTDTTIKYSGSTALLTGAATGSTAVLTNCTYISSTNALLAGNITTTLVNVSFKDEATAIANKAVARIGSDVTKGYYSDFATAVAAAKTGDTIYVIANATCPALTIDGKSLTIIGSNGATLTSTGTNILTGGAALTIEDLNVSNPSATFVRLDNGTLTFTGKTVKSTVTGKIFTTIGGKGTVNVSNATMTVTYLTHILTTADGPVNVTATNVDFKGTLERAINSAAESTKTPKVTATLENITVEKCKMLLEFANGSSLSADSVFTLTNVTATATSRVLSSGSNCNLGTVYIEDCNFTTADPQVLRLYGITKYIATNSTFKSTSTDGTGALLYIAADTVSGEFTNCTFEGTGTNPCVKVDPATTATFTGCTFTHTDATKIFSTNTYATVIVDNTCKINGKVIDDAAAAKGGLAARIGTTYYNSLLTAVAMAKTGDTIVLIGNHTVGTAFEIANKSVTVIAAEGVTLTINKTIRVGNGATLIVDGVTISGTGNNSEAPFAMTATTSKGTLKFINATVTAAEDLIHVGGSNAVLADIVVDNSTLNVTKDTTLDYRNTNEGTLVNFTVQNKTVWNSGAGVYVYNAKGLLNVTLEDCTFTGGSTFSVDSLAQPADGKGLTDADGKGNYALAITAKNITVTTSGYFLRLNGTTCVGNVSLNIIGTKTGTGASAVHSNVINGAFAQLAGANDRVQIRATGLKAGGNNYSVIYMIGSTNTIDMEFEGITFTASAGNGRAFNSESSATHTNLIIKIKDANVTAGDKSTYSNEINAKQISFLLRGFKNIDLQLTGVIATRLPQDTAGAVIDVQTPTAANTANGVSITLTDVYVSNHTYVITNSVLACDVTATLTNVNANTTHAFLNVHADATHTMNATVTNSTYTKGSASVVVDGSYAITGSTVTLTNVANPDRVVELALTAFSLRITGIDAKGTTYYPSLNQALVDLATANATKQGTIYVVRNITQASKIILGDGVADTNYKPYDLVVVGLKTSTGAYPTLTSSTDYFSIYDGSDIAFRDITITAANRWIRVWDDKCTSADFTNIVFGDNCTITTTRTGSEDFIFAAAKSYTNITLETTAKLVVKQSATDGRKTVIAFNGAYGKIIVRGTIEATMAAGSAGTARFIFFQMGSNDGNIIIESTAKISYSFTGSYKSAQFIDSSALAVIKSGAMINGAAINDESAKAIGFNVRNNAADGSLAFYANAISSLTYNNMNTGSTYTLIGNANIYVWENGLHFTGRLVNTEFSITSVAGQKYTLTLPSGYAAFNLGANTKLTMTNMTLDLTPATKANSNNGRFARVDGDSHVIIGAGTTVNCSAGIFIYSNVNGAWDITATYDFQAGSVINWTSASGSLIYHDGLKDLDGDKKYDSAGEKQKLTLNVYISGELNVASTATSKTGAITDDKNNNSSYIVWIDFTTAKITCPAANWFYHCDQNSPVYMTGLDTIEEYDAIARKASLAVRSGAKIGEGVWVPYTGFRGQINEIAIEVLPEGENTLYLLENISSINSTMHFYGSFREEFRIVSNKIDGTQATIGFQGAHYRFRVRGGATLILDNVKLSTTGSSGYILQFMEGTLDNPSTLVLMNGSTLTSNVTTAALSFDGSSFGLVKIESKEALETLDAYAKSFALKVRLDAENGASYTNVLSTNAVAYATADGAKAAHLYILDSFTSAQVKLGDGADDANYKPYNVTITGLKVGGATAYPTITYNGELFVFYDGSDLAMYNINFSSTARWMRIYNTACTEPCNIVFGAGTTLTQTTASSNDDFILIANNSYANITVEEGATLSRTLTAASTEANKCMISTSNLHGTITIAGTLEFNCNSKDDENAPTPAYMFNASGADSAVVIKSTASITFNPTGECAGSAVFANHSLITIEDGATVNGTTYEKSWQAAQALGLTAEYTHKDDGKVYYTNDLTYALKNAKDATTVTLLRDDSFSIVVLSGRELTITSPVGSTFTATLTSGYAAFQIENGSKLTLENVTVTLNEIKDGGRFARIDGASHVIFGNGATVNCVASIFIYNNGNGLSGGYAYTIDFLAGSVINATTKMGNGLIYHTNAAAAGADVTVNIAGKINIPTDSPITKDVNFNGKYVVNYDASTADITCGSATWFSNNTLVYFKNLEGDALQAKALEAGLGVRYGNVYAAGIYTPMLDLIPAGGEAIIYILQDVNTICHAAFSNKTITIKSDPAAGTDYYTITSVSTNLFFLIGENAHLILDNINIVTGAFIRFEPVNVDNAFITVDFNSGATVTASRADTYPHFIYAGSQNKPVLLTINVNTGAKVGRPANTWAAASGDRNCYLINLKNFGSNLLAGSTVNVAGTMEELTEFEGTGARRSSIILATDSDLTVNVTPGAVFNYNAGTHGINADEGLIHTYGVVNISGGAFNIIGDTSMMPVFWLRATSVYNLSGTIVFNATGLEYFFYSYGANAQINFNNVTFITNVPNSIQLNHPQSGVSNTPAITVVNSTFSNETVANVLNATVTLDNGNGLSGRYDLASAIALVESGATVYLHANSVIASTIVLDGKAITIAPMGDEAMTLALYSDTVGKMFVLKNGASLSLSNLNVVITVTTPDRYRVSNTIGAENVNTFTNVIGTFLTVDGAEGSAQVVVVLNNVNLNAPNSQPFYFAGYSDTVLTINGGSIVGGRGVFTVGAYMDSIVGSGTSAKPEISGISHAASAKLALTITGTADKHVSISNTGSAGEGSSLIYLNNTLGKDSVVVNLDYVDITSNSQWGIYLRGSSALTLNYNHGTFKNTNNAWLFGSQSGTAWYVNFTDVVLDGGATSCSSGAIRPYGVANSYINFTDCELNFKHKLSFNQGIAVTMTNTVINFTDDAPVFSYDALGDTSIVLDGCTLNTTSQIASASNNVMVKGATKILVGEELVALTAEIALERGLVVELEGAGVYASNLLTQLFNEVTDTYNKVLIHSNITISKPAYITNKNVTIEGVGENITITAPKGLRPFYVEGNSNVTFKNLTADVSRFLTINATEDDDAVTITFENANVIVSDYSNDPDAVIYKGHSKGTMTLNIDADSSVVVNSSKALAAGTTTYAAIYIGHGAGTTINVWGTIKNLMKTADGQNAQVISVKGKNNNAIVNIYDGAVLEGTSSYGKYTGSHSGSYCGIIYFSEGAGGNTLNIEGGEITIHGVTGLAYTGTKATINISGNAVINNVDAQYAMFFGGAQTLNIRGNENGAPTFNTPAKLIGNGMAGLYAYDTGYSYETAKALGFTVALASKDFFAGLINRVTFDQFGSEETLYLLADATMTQNCGGDEYKPLDNVKLTITSYGDAKCAIKSGITGGNIAFWVSTNAHLIFDNVIWDASSRLIRLDNEDASAFMTVEFTKNAEIYASNSTDGNFIYSPSGAGLLTINIEEGAIIQRKGTVADGKPSHLFNIGNTGFVAGSVINVKGTISNVSNYTGTSKMSAYLFNVPDADITINVYPTAKFEMAMTKTNASAVIDEKVFTPAGLVYFQDYAEGTNYDEIANNLGLALHTDAVANVYAKYLTAQFMALVPNNSTIYVMNDFFFANSFTLDGKNVTLEGMRDGITLTQSATVTLINDSSFTVKNMAIISSARFVNSSTVTNANTVKLENVKITTSAGKDSDIILVSNSKAAIEITNCEFYTTTNRVLFVHASTNGIVTALKATNVKLNSALFRAGNTTGVIGSESAPAVLTDITFESAVVDGSAVSAFMYGYTGTIYADIFGGSFKGQFFYGGDNNPNTLAIRVNPTGDKHTTISTLNPSTTSVYSALIHMNHGSVKNVTLAFRNTTLSDVGGQTALIQARTNTNLNIRVENTTFEGKAFLAIGSNYSAVTGYFDSAATAKKFGFNVRLGDNVGAGYYYLFVNLALEAAKDGDTIYLMGNAASVNVGNDTTRFAKKVHITSEPGAIYTITNSASIPFYLGTGAELKFTNVTYTMAVRFARVDGNSTIIFGEGTTLNCKDTIFIYANASAVSSTITLTVDFQPGSVLNWTAASGKLIYHNGAKDLNGDGDTTDSGEKYKMNTTLYISGELNIASTTTGAITSDDNNGSAYIVWIDFTTAKINCASKTWFNHCEQLSPVYMTGLNSIEEYDAIARKASLAVRSGAKIGEGVWVPYTGFRGQINQIAIDVLPEGENTLYLLEDISSINSTMHFKGRDSFRIVSAKANGATATLKMQGDANRIRVYSGSPLTIDNVKISTTGTKGLLMQFHNGTAAAPSTLILTNGATLSSAKASAAFTFDTFSLVKIESSSSVTDLDTFAKSFALKVRLDAENGASYTNVLSTNAVAYATQSGKKAATLTVLDSHSASVTLGDGADDAAFTPYDITIVGIKVNGATAYPTLTFATDAFKMYDGSDVTFSNINITSSYRWLRIYNTKCTDPCDIVFAAGTTATQKTASSNDDFIYITGGSYCNLTVEKGATLSRTLTAANTTAYKTMISSANLNGTITVAGTLIFDCTSTLNTNSKPTPAYMFSASGANSAIVIKSTANISFTAKGKCDGSRLCLNNTLVTIEGGMTVNNKACATAEDAAKELGLAFSYTANNGNKHFTHALAQATSVAANGSTIYVLCDITLTNSAYVTDKTLTLQGINDSIVVTTGEVKADGTISKSGIRMIYLSGNANLTIKDLNFVTNRFASFTSSVASTGVLTLNNVDVTVPDYSVDMDALIYCGAATNKVVINIDANSSIVLNSSVAPASGTTVYATIAIYNGVGTTINIWGTVKNLMKTVDGANAQVIAVKGANNNAIVNIYEGAVLEGTSDSESYTGNYTGIIYFSEGKGGNELNIYGGEITIHGNTGLAYLGTSAKVNISGNVVINNIDNTKYELFGKTPVTIVITANDAGTPVFNFACKFVPNGVKNLMTATGFTWTDSVAAMLGFSIRSGETSFTNYISQTDVDAADTIYVLGNTVNVLDELVIDGKTLSIVNTGNITATLVNSPFTTITRMFTLKNGATLTITNVNVTTTSDTVDRNVNTAGVFITVDEATPNGTVNVTLNNVTLSATKGIPFYFGSNSIVNVTINGGSYTGEGMFAIGYTANESATGKGDGVDVTSNATVTVTITGTHENHVLLRRTAGGDQNAVIFVNQSGTALANKDKVKFILNHADIGREGAANATTGIYLRNEAALTLEQTCGQFYGDGWLFASQANCAYYATFTDVDFTGTRTDFIIRPYGAAGAGSYINITGGSITATRVAASKYILSFNTNITVSIKDTVITSTNAAPIFGTESGAGLSITVDNINIAGAPGMLVHATKTPALFNKGIYMIDDAAAIAKGLMFRVGPEGGLYFNSIASAVAAVADGGKVYILGNSTEGASDINLNKYVIFELVNAPAEGFTITHTGTGNLFLITEGSASAPVRVVMNNLTFKSTSATGAIFALSGNGYAIFELTNCTVNTTNGGVFNASGKASATVTIQSGSYTASYRPFYIVGESAFKFTAKDASFQGLSSGNDGTIFFFDNTNGYTGAVSLTFTDCRIFNTTSSGHGIYAMTTSRVDLNMTNVELNVKGWCLSSQSNTTWHANLKNVTFITNSANHAVRLYGAAGSYLNIEGGTFLQNSTSTSTNEAVLAVGNSITLNFFDGYVESNDIACITGLGATVTINIYGGTFRYTGNAVGVGPVSLPNRAVINVKGGNFITESKLGPVFSNVANSANTLNLECYNAIGNANLITNLGIGTPSAAHDAYGRTSLNTIVMTTGATPILTEGAMGLGFKAELDANAYYYLRGLAADSVLKFGMLVIPTEKLDESNFTLYGFQQKGLVEGVDYFNIKAGETDITTANDGCVVVKLALTNISEENYDTAYSVVFYTSYDVNFELNGELISTHTVYQYADYERSENSRSLAQVARAAYNDTSATQDSYYVNPVENTALYSHYTAEELAQLAIWCGNDTTQKTLDIFLIAGGSNAAGNTAYGNEFATDFNKNNSISGNVFYSGMISDYATQTYGSTTLKFVASKYTAIGTAPVLGMGAQAGLIGPELGMATELSKYYNSDSGKYAAIMKYAFNDVNLVDVEGSDMTSAKFYNDFMQMVIDQIADYESQGYKVNVVGMYWMQGETDVANATNYTAAFNALANNVRTDLSNATGADLSAMPIVVGEIATFLNGAYSAEHEAFAQMQNTFTTIAGVTVDATSKYVADANGIFANPADVLATGERVAAKLITSGANTLDPDVSAEIVVPGIQNNNEIYTADGTPWTDTEGNVIGFTSLEMAIAKVPAGSVIKLTSDQTVFSSINLVNADNITIDGNGTTITVNSTEAGFVLQNSNVTLNNFKLDHKGTAVALKVDANSSVVIDGNSSIIAESTAIELMGENSVLTIKNGEFMTRSADDYNDAIIRTASAHVTVTGGNFVAAAGGSCIHIGKIASDKLTVNIKGGTFTTYDVVAPVMAADGLQEVDANGVALTATVQAIAFVNEYVLAILVISPDAVINSSIVSNNAGLGA